MIVVKYPTIGAYATYFKDVNGEYNVFIPTLKGSVRLNDREVLLGLEDALENGATLEYKPD